MAVAAARRRADGDEHRLGPATASSRSPVKPTGPRRHSLPPACRARARISECVPREARPASRYPLPSRLHQCRIRRSRQRIPARHSRRRSSQYACMRTFTFGGLIKHRAAGQCQPQSHQPAGWPILRPSPVALTSRSAGEDGGEIDQPKTVWAQKSADIAAELLYGQPASNSQSPHGSRRPARTRAQLMPDAQTCATRGECERSRAVPKRESLAGPLRVSCTEHRPAR